MFDASALDYADNAAATADVSCWCHERGAWVEAELGEVGGKDFHGAVLDGRGEVFHGIAEAGG
jgi:fructose/tagatose bisphosphate aldolase